MLDPHLLRNNPNDIGEALRKRGFELDVESLSALEAKRKAMQVKTQALQAERNHRSREIGKVKASGEDIQPLLDEVASLGDELAASEAELAVIQGELEEVLHSIPNIPHDDVPAGKTEADNKELMRWGEIKKLGVTAKDHVELGESLGLMDFNAAANIASARFVVLRGALAGLHRALVQFMLDTHIREHGYEEVNVPYLVNPASLFGTGQLPKFADDQFHIEKQALYLIPTAEVPVTNIHRDEIIEAEKLPLKYVCHSPCFRSEAGSYGKDARGMIRQHQFEKVELVQFVRPDESDQALEALTGHAETILQKLQLPYRKVILCGADLGFSSALTYDLEVWLPGQHTYREVSSCSNFRAFQARRLKARFRNSDTGKPEWLHTLNGSGLAVGRTLIAVMENYQDEQGRIRIPEVLLEYMGKLKVIEQAI